MLDEYEALLAYEEASLMDAVAYAPSAAHCVSPLSPPTTSQMIDERGSRRSDASAFTCLRGQHSWNQP